MRVPAIRSCRARCAGPSARKKPKNVMDPTTAANTTNSHRPTNSASVISRNPVVKALRNRALKLVGASTFIQRRLASLVFAAE